MSRVSKLHEAIVTSSIWNEDDATRIVWVTMLAIRDHKGFVGASIGGLAHTARVSVKACGEAVGKFLGPDPDSRTKEDDGRRIREVDGGWIIINHRKYSEARDEEGALARRSELAKERAKRCRERKSLKIDPKVTPVALRSVTPRDAALPDALPVDAQKPLFELEPTVPTQAPKKNAKRLPTTDISKRIAKLFHRRLTTAWTKDEVAKYRDLGEIDPADIGLIEAYYRAERVKGDEGRHRRDLTTFLNNFAGELDRARLATPKSKNPNAEADPAGWREFLAGLKKPYTPHRFALDFLKTQFAKR